MEYKNIQKLIVFIKRYIIQEIVVSAVIPLPKGKIKGVSPSNINGSAGNRKKLTTCSPLHLLYYCNSPVKLLYASFYLRKK